MITIGIDPHKRTHTAVAVNDVGQQLDEITFPADEEGQQSFLAWAHGLEGEGQLRFALEDCRHVNGRLERFLLAADEGVLRVPPKLMAGARDSAARVASRTRSTPSRSPGRRCAKRRSCTPRATIPRRGS